MEQAAVLVQVVGAHLGEVQIAGLIGLDEVLVGADGRGAGGKTQHAGGVGHDLSGDDGRRLAAHVLVVLGVDDTHSALLSSGRSNPGQCGPVGRNQRKTRTIQGEGAYVKSPHRVEAPARPQRLGPLRPSTSIVKLAAGIARGRSSSGAALLAYRINPAELQRRARPQHRAHRSVHTTSTQGAPLRLARNGAHRRYARGTPAYVHRGRATVVAVLKTAPDSQWAAPQRQSRAHSGHRPAQIRTYRERVTMS